MRKQIIFTAIVSLCSFGMIDSNQITDNLTDTEINVVDLLKEKEEEKLKIEQYHKLELENFLYAIGHRESTNRYDVVNPWGYMGRYQFGKSTLRTLGYKVTRKEFLSNHSLQEEAMLSLLQHNQYSLKYYIKTYEGQNIWGVNITESGLLAAAHLAGSGNVIKFFDKGSDFADANGTKMTFYMKQFGGYRLNI